MQSHSPAIIVLVGITGDLAKRKLLPAIDEIGRAGLLPEKFNIIGVTRRPDVTVGDLTSASYLHEHTELFQMDLTNLGDYRRLRAHLRALEKQFGAATQRLFYLSVPPQIAQQIIGLLGRSGLAKLATTKLLLEKPFGVDLASATELVGHINAHFAPEQVYRIDHYLAKEMAQNLIVFREQNVLFKETWRNQFIERIAITASEKIGVEGRNTFYEQTGALRDFVQSHLLQLAAITLMDAPRPGDLLKVPARRLAALKKLRLATDKKTGWLAKRGQYKGYAREVGNPGSVVETFVALTLESRDPKWRGVPITLATGKALAEKSTEIRITYKQQPGQEPNELILRLQPNEGVELDLWAKRPGYERQTQKRSLRFRYHNQDRLAEAYEQVFLDAINAESSLFATSDEILETWRILDPLQKAWEMGAEDLVVYKPGTELAKLL